MVHVRGLHVGVCTCKLQLILDCQEVDEVPKDFLSLYDDTLFKFDTDLIPEAVMLYDVCIIVVVYRNLLPLRHCYTQHSHLLVVRIMSD